MARARNIKPAFFDNDELADLEPLARLLFIGLWTLCDYQGNLEWRSKRIKKQLLAYDDCDIEELAINLDKSGFVRFYSDGDKTYLNVSNFSKHQNPHKNERDKGSEIPSYTEEQRQVIDLNGLTINRDKSGLKRNSSTSNPADSLNLIPDPLNLIPDSTNPESNQKKKKVSAKLDYSSWPSMPTEQVMNDWLALRKRLKANVSQTVINRFAKEFQKAAQYGFTVDHCLTECVAKGWRGFEADWIMKNQSAQGYGGNQQMSAAAAQTFKNLKDGF
ncbi:hypothetical protein NVP1232O_59 [Vibrio phage 1.232.O._10N.261.51.E11]|nr:hypothetical protein NVP1232O_59 [Vibrio phage 1.232.O._10N.261.51.E11]